MEDDSLFFTPDIIGKAMQEPDWPRGTEVVVYARKEDREKVLMVTSLKGYVVTKFVEVSGLQAKLMGEGRFIAAKAEFLYEGIKRKTDYITAVQAQEDRLKDSVIPIPPDLIEQMKRDYPKWRSQMLGGTRPSDWPGLSKEQENE